MIPKLIIEKAILGGWHKEEKPRISENNDGLWVEFDVGDDTRTLHESDIALDPLFWSALGKSCGWTREYQWRINAEKFYRVILSDGDTAAFWEEILPTN